MRTLLALPLAALALTAGASTASASEPLTCRDERTGYERAVTVALGDGDNSYHARSGDVIAAMGGNDTIIVPFNAADVTVCLGAGDDIAVVYGGPASVRGGAGSDSIYGGPGNDAFNGVDGNDFIDGGGGFDVARGGAGFDRSLNNEIAYEFEVVG